MLTLETYTSPLVTALTVLPATIAALGALYVSVQNNRKSKERDGALDEIARTGEKTHTLVNSNMAVQLRLNAALTRRVANMTHDAADVEAADKAAKMLREHEEKQKTVDDREDGEGL